MSNKVVVFGAGATGRGHVGLLAWQAGCELVFVDQRADLIACLQQAGQYVVRLYGTAASAGQPSQEVCVRGFQAFRSEQRQVICDHIAGATLVLTAVFDHNLADVAETLALAVRACRTRGRTTPLNCIACENMMDSSSTLGKHVRTHLKGPDLEYCERYWGFPDCMISRVVPRPEPDPLVIVTEDYNEWTARAEAFKGERPPELAALELVNNQTARLERKLFIHNGGHAICGYVGFHRHWAYVHEALQDTVVAQHVWGALDELGEVVRRKHGFSAESIDAYKNDLARRGAIAEMRDAILRVVRDPIRKLSPRERLVAPAMLAVEYGLPRRWIVQGIVAALRYHHSNDPQSLALSDRLEQQGLSAVLREIGGIEAGSVLAGEIERAWADWQMG
jgi:mannitol-1-phosphate 5-dehydrogenase